MKMKFFFPMYFCCIIIFLFGIFQSGCNSPHSNSISDTKEFSDDWITLDVKFKPYTNGEVRDISVRALEQLLVDSIKVMREGLYPNFSPSFKVSKDLFGDTLEYFLGVGKPLPMPPPINTSGQNYNTVATSDTISNPKCYCRNNCGVCLMMNSIANNPKDTSNNSPYKAIESITVLGQ
jgi:hypothetical protein